ncbi:MAG: hypothetical protein GY861_05560 [bacterium]|nr:hypothetical protein [bacterium]
MGEERTTSRSVYDLFRRIVQSILSVEDLYSERGTISSVDVDDRTCVVTLITGGTVSDVKLQATAESAVGMLIEPKVNTPCVITFMGRKDAFLSMVDEVENVFITASDSVIINGGSNDGLINITELTSELNDFKNEIAAELVKIQSGIATAGGAYAPGVLSTFTKSSYEDTNVKH